MQTCRPLAAAFATAFLACASSPPSQSPSPTTKSNTLEVGQERAGTLSAADSVGSDRRAQSWALVGHRGQPIVVDLISTQFDPTLEIVGPGIRPLVDDDGGGACNARVSFTPPEDGLYWIVVEGTTGTSQGAFTLRASRDGGPPASGSCDGPVTERFNAHDLSDIPVKGPLPLGEELRGELTSQDGKLKDGYARAYELRAQRGTSLTIDLKSTAFDAYLVVTGPGLEKPLENDDDGGGCDARLHLAVPADGAYRVIVTSANDGETGRFTLKASTNAPAIEEHACGGPDPEHHASSDISPDELNTLAVQGTVRVGDDIAGELKESTPTIVDGTHALVWTIAGAKGKTVIVDLVSDAFDAYLMVTGPGMTDVLTDDDTGGACNPRLALTFPADGVYRLVANTVDKGAIGKFHLKVSLEKGPVATGSCGGGRAR